MTGRADARAMRAEPSMFARLIACVLFVAAAHVCAVAAPQAAGPNTYRLTYPAKDWSLDVDLSDFRVLHEEFFEGGRRYLLVAWLIGGGKPSTPPVVLHVTLDPRPGAVGGAGLSAWAAERTKRLKAIGADSVKAFEHRGIPVVRYRRKVLLGSYQPFVINGRTMDAFLLKDDVLITIRIGGESLGDRGERTFLSVLDSIRLTDTLQPSSSFDHYHAGKSRLLAKDYAGAQRSLATALELERRGRQLGEEQWRDLIGRAFDASSAAGDLAGARRVLEYGISQEPENLIFHLWLARVHAFLGDLDATIASLESVFRHRTNQPRPHTPFDPLSNLDPLSHPSFARFKDDEKFRRAVKAMKK